MSIFGKHIGISEQRRAELRIFFAVLLGSLCLVSDIVFAGCGFVDIAAISLVSPTNRFVDGGYNGFSDQPGKIVGDCYADKVRQNGLLGVNLLSTLSSDQTTDTINNTRGSNPINKLLVAHRGGPDWANGIPDNSVEAFKKSIGNGVSSVEVDLQMDSKRNLIAYHDVSFAGTVRTDDQALSQTINQAIQSNEWITRNMNDRKLDDSKLLKLRRVIPNSFTFDKTENGITYLKISSAATEPQTQVNVSSFHKVISEIQAASQSKFGNRTAVNIFLDAAKSKDITIAAINRLRRSQLIAGEKIYNDINDVLSVPATEAIAVQFKINDFPGGADEMAQALCDSPENKITYKKLVVKVRNPRMWGVFKVYFDEIRISYFDSTDNFSNSYGYSAKRGPMYFLFPYNVRLGEYFRQDGPPVKLWGDAASGTCDIRDIQNSGIALVPVVEKTVPYKATLDSYGNPAPNTVSDYARSIMNFLIPFKKYFKMNIIEFSYTPLDTTYYSTADPRQPINTGVNSQDIYREMTSKQLDSVFSNQKYIYQTFNRFFDINFFQSSDATYNGLYLCAAQANGDGSYAYRCNTQALDSLDEQGFEYRAKPGFYTGVCRQTSSSPFFADSFGLTTTDNPLLEIYLNGSDIQPGYWQYRDLCSRDNQGGRMSNYTTRYKSFVGNPSFRLRGGI